MADEAQDNDSDRGQRLDAVIAQYLTAVQSNFCPDREEFLRKYPDLAGQLQTFFSDHDRFEKLATTIRSELPESPGGKRPGSESATQGYAPRSGSAEPASETRFGDYELGEEISRGGMGVVYRATQISLNRPVALKMILAGNLASPADIERFRREAEAAARLDHPHIVPIYEVGEHDGRHYFSMKLIEGGDLTQHLPRFAGDHRAAAVLVAAAAEGVHHAHQRGILHRDLKPRNILVDRDGEPHLTDFGLAKRVEEGGQVTQSGAVVGTASYMAPEQARAEKSPTTAVDVYSLGAVLFELLTGRPPFVAATPAETILQVLEREPPHPRAVQPTVGADLATICLKCLEKEASRRYGSAAQLAEDLRAWLDGRPITARPVGTAERLWRWSRRHPLPVAGSALMVCLIAFFSWSLWRENRATHAALARESLAVRETQVARDQAQDHLARSLYEQARALATSATTGRRWQILELVRESEQLRGRQRETRDVPARSDEQQGLPSRAALRSAALSALLPHDVRLSFSEGMEASQPGLSPNGRFVLFSSGRGVSILDLRGNSRRDYEGIRGDALAIDGSGHRLAAWQAETDALTAWDLAAGTKGTPLEWPAAPEAAGKSRPRVGRLLSSELNWSSDGRYLAAIYRTPGSTQTQSLVLWDLFTDRRPQSLVTTPANSDGGGACFSEDGSTIAYPIAEQVVAFWESKTMRKMREIHLPLPLVGRPALSAAGTRLACPCSGPEDQESMILVWDVDDNLEGLRLPAGADLRASVVSFHPSANRLALATRDGRLSVFDLATGRQVLDLPGAHPFAIAVLGWNQHSSQLVSWGMIEGVLRCWELGEPAVTELSTGLKASHFASSPDGKWLAVAEDKGPRLRVLERATGTLYREFLGSDSATRGRLVFSRDSRQLAEIDTYCAVVWDLGTGQFLARLEPDTGLPGLITSVVFTPQGDLWASIHSSQPRRMAVWDVLRRREVWHSPADLTLQSAFLVSSGSVLAGIAQTGFNSQATLVAIEIPSGRVLARSDLPGSPIDSQAFSPDGQWMASLHYLSGDPMFAVFGSAGSARTEAEIALRSFPLAEQQVSIAGSSIPTATAFSMDSRLLAIGYRDGLIRLCRVSSGEELFHYRMRSRPVSQLAFSNDGTTLIAADGDSSVQVLDLRELQQHLTPIALAW